MSATTLTIKTALRNGHTYLSEAYATPPLKVADVTEDKKGRYLDLMIMSSSPGTLDEDNYQIKITIGPGCCLKLRTQSYQRLFTMERGATQTMDVHLEKGSSFCYIPHPTVPHTGAVYKATSSIFLADDCTLTWGEIITCGRKLSGEQFQFKRLHLVTDIFLSNKLIVKENLVIEPGRTSIPAIGQWEGYTHQATLIFINSEVSTSELIQEINNFLSKEKQVIFGVSLAPANGIVVRILGYKGEQLFNCLNSVSQLLLSFKRKSEPAYAS